MRKAVAASALKILVYAYLFFLSIDFLSTGMKSSFKHALNTWMETNANDFTELRAFVVGVLGTSLVQSSSTVTSMAVVLTQDEVVPLLIAIGIVHGANLGTSVTSSLVAFASSAPPLSGNPFRDLRTLLFAPRAPGFHRAVSTAVVHGLFNALLVTLILLVLELPFGVIHALASETAGYFNNITAAGADATHAAAVLSPKAYTKPVTAWLSGVGVPAWGLVALSFVLLFQSLKGFSRSMRSMLIAGDQQASPEALGKKLLGRTPIDTFVRGLVLTMLVQSSSATTSMVVPLAALGFFSLRQVFPFIMGANIGTTFTALIVATSGVGQPGFEAGMTIALSHLYLNCLAVLIAAVIPQVRESVLSATTWLADMSVKSPSALLGYLGVLTVVAPIVVYFLPMELAGACLLGAVAFLMIWPPIHQKRHQAAVSEDYAAAAK